jgi:hypothetical protein
VGAAPQVFSILVHGGSDFLGRAAKIELQMLMRLPEWFPSVNSMLSAVVGYSLTAWK